MRLLIFGLGYSASRFVELHRDRFESVVGTVRDPGRAAALSQVQGHLVLPFAGGPSANLDRAIETATHVLVSVPAEGAGDPVLAAVADRLLVAPVLEWIGYYSTVGVYGDFGGAWVDETSPTRPASTRGQRRLEAEQGWLRLARARSTLCQVLRLGGIYGPGQNAIESVRGGTARRIVKPGQVFNRIHVDDIAGATCAALMRPAVGPLINVVDNEPCPPQDVIAHAAALLGIAPPPEVPFESADLSPMGRSFYGENKRCSNRRLREEVGYVLRFPTYREGLAAALKAQTVR